MSWRRLAAFVLAVGLLIRIWPWLLAPQLAWEDGALLFARSYDEFHVADWWQPYSGYVPFGSNLLASLLCRLPTEWIPSGFVIGAASISLGAGAWFLRASYRTVAPFAARCLVAVVVAWLPLASHPLVTSLAYAQWPALWWLMLLLFEPTVGRGVGRAALVTVLAWSHPLSVLLVPFTLWRVRRQQGSGGATLCFAVVVLWTVRALVGSGGDGPAAVDAAGGPELVALVSVRVVLESLIGERLRLALVATGGAWLVIAAVLANVVVGVSLWRGCRLLAAPARDFVVSLLLFATATVLASALVRTVCRYDDLDCVRYLWIARVALLASILIVLARRLRARWLLAAFVVPAGLVMVGDPVRHGPHPSAALQAFVAELGRQERERGGRTWIRARCERTGQPPIVIRPH